MQDYERSLFIVMCLGHRLEGQESAEEIEEILTAINAESERQQVCPAQEELAEWLDVSLAHCQNRQSASIKLWDRINARRYSLADVPMRLRREAFGGSLEIQKRMGKRPWYFRLARKFSSLVKAGITLILAGGVIWIAIRILTD